MTKDKIDRKLDLIDTIASKLWGKDLRNCSIVSQAICLPIIEYVDEELKAIRKQFARSLLEKPTPTKHLISDGFGRNNISFTFVDWGNALRISDNRSNERSQVIIPHPSAKDLYDFLHQHFNKEANER